MHCELVRQSEKLKIRKRGMEICLVSGNETSRSSEVEWTQQKNEVGGNDQRGYRFEEEYTRLKVRPENRWRDGVKEAVDDKNSIKRMRGEGLVWDRVNQNNGRREANIQNLQHNAPVGLRQ